MNLATVRAFICTELKTLLNFKKNQAGGKIVASG